MWNVSAVVTSSQAAGTTTPPSTTASSAPEVTSPLDLPAIHFIFTFAYIFVFFATVVGECELFLRADYFKPEACLILLSLRIIIHPAAWELHE